MAALVSDDPVECTAGSFLAPVGRVFTGPFSTANESASLLCLWRADRCRLRSHVAPIRRSPDTLGMCGIGVCGGFTSFFPVISLVRNVAGSSEIIQLAVVVGNSRGGSGLGMVAGAVAVGGALGMEIRPDHTGVHSRTGIAVGKLGI